MKQFLYDLLRDDSPVSSMRLMALFSLLIGACIAVCGMIISKDLMGVAELSAVFVGSAFGGKVVQKFTERS